DGRERGRLIGVAEDLAAQGPSERLHLGAIGAHGDRGEALRGPERFEHHREARAREAFALALREHARETALRASERLGRDERGDSHENASTALRRTSRARRARSSRLLMTIEASKSRG